MLATSEDHRAEPEPEDGQKDEPRDHGRRVQGRIRVEGGEKTSERERRHAEKKKEGNRHRHAAAEDRKLRTSQEEAEEEENVGVRHLSSGSDGQQTEKEKADVVQPPRKAQLCVGPSRRGFVEVLGRRTRCRQPNAQGASLLGESRHVRRQRTARPRGGRLRREPIGREARPRQSLPPGRPPRRPQARQLATRHGTDAECQTLHEVPPRPRGGRKTRLAHADQSEQEEKAAAPGERQGERHALDTERGSRNATAGTSRTQDATSASVPRPGCPSPFTPSVRTRRAAMKRLPTSRIRAMDVASPNSLPKKVVSRSGRPRTKAPRRPTQRSDADEEVPP